MYQILTQQVIHGKKLWRILWFPTANLKLEKNCIEDWVYKINIIYNGKIYSWAGTARNELNLFEAHIFHFDMMIYGKTLEVIPIMKIRENRKFNNQQELKEQIQKDIETAKQTKIQVMTFWTFDIFHEGHKYFLSEAKKYWDLLITIIATDKNVKALKKEKPTHSQEKRMNTVKLSNISDKVIIWDEEYPMKWVEFYTPDIIALGYDQIGFSQILSKRFPSIKTVRIWDYKKDIYKSSLLKKIS